MKFVGGRLTSLTWSPTPTPAYLNSLNITLHICAIKEASRTYSPGLERVAAIFCVSTSHDDSAGKNRRISTMLCRLAAAEHVHHDVINCQRRDPAFAQRHDLPRLLPKKNSALLKKAHLCRSRLRMHEEVSIQLKYVTIPATWRKSRIPRLKGNNYHTCIMPITLDCKVQ